MHHRVPLHVDEDEPAHPVSHGQDLPVGPPGQAEALQVVGGRPPRPHLLPVEPVERDLPADVGHGQDVHLGRPQQANDLWVDRPLLQLPHGGQSRARLRHGQDGWRTQVYGLDLAG